MATPQLGPCDVPLWVKGVLADCRGGPVHDATVARNLDGGAITLGAGVFRAYLFEAGAGIGRVAVLATAKPHRVARQRLSSPVRLPAALPADHLRWVLVFPEPVAAYGVELLLVVEQRGAIEEDDIEGLRLRGVEIVE